MAAKKYYAIKEGFDKVNEIKIEDKIVNTWAECKKYVIGAKGAKYKSFESLEKAKEFLNGGITSVNNTSYKPLSGELLAYVDGSFNSSTEKYSYAIVMVQDDVIIYIENGCAEDDSLRSIRQIAGELKASVNSLKYAAKNGYKKIVVFHDYVGVANHATGFWNPKEESSKIYNREMNDLMKEHDIQVQFVKVDSHTGDLYNEIVDEFAKAAGEVEVKGETRKLLKNRSIKVENEDIKDKFFEIVSEDVMKNIIVNEK